MQPRCICRCVVSYAAWNKSRASICAVFRDRFRNIASTVCNETRALFIDDGALRFDTPRVCSSAEHKSTCDTRRRHRKGVHVCTNKRRFTCTYAWVYSKKRKLKECNVPEVRSEFNWWNFIQLNSLERDMECLLAMVFQNNNVSLFNTEQAIIKRKIFYSAKTKEERIM